MYSGFRVFNFIYTFCFSFYRNEKSFICNYKEHWFTVRKLGKQVTLSFFILKLTSEMGVEKWLQVDCASLLQVSAEVWFNSIPYFKKGKCLFYHTNARQVFVNVSLGKDCRISSLVNLSFRELQLW